MTATGSYYVTAEWTLSTCTNTSETITIGSVTPPVDFYSLASGQEYSYCSTEEDAGVTVTVANTSADVYYELVDITDGDNPVSVQILKGNGGDVTFNNLVTGTTIYTITVQGDSSLFDIEGESQFTITEYATPQVYTVNSGAGNQSILLSDSEETVWYFLMRDGDYAFDQPEFGIKGTGGSLEFPFVELPGDYYVLAVGEGGCEVLMNGFVTIHQSNLLAQPDTLYLEADELSGSIDLSALISGRTSSDDVLVYSANIINEGLGASITIDENTGLLTYFKAPSFFGKDSLHYSVANRSIADRKAASYIIIMAGNKDFGDVQSFLLPNAFSPNGDGINERFVISGLGQTEESSLEVFNRWGTIVYRSEGTRYNNNWDGTSNVGAMISIGKELPNGVYFYVFEVKKNVQGSLQTRRFSGYVELRR
ncbi:gliding motility-associated C-terminal domain-containing protein [Geofilum rubicundum]|uniref:Muc19 n=1 Tax=Geofilum rubicundum JCM 15548 TaxID=1236989 RepID=A0A0E9LRD0_9BACT|nr:gliding motility-associated C-terminal domain-containing protein [Geofilum rubicundum]GAO27701.1 Muc19 precursor [Geofilum rubicundum JCM 15548]